MTDLENKIKKCLFIANDINEAAKSCAQIAQQYAEEMAIKFKDWCESDIAHHLENNRNYSTKELYQQFLKETGK